MTATLYDDPGAATEDAQYVKIRGTLGHTGEQKCDANFNVYGEDVTCSLESDVDIGEYLCLVWRTAAGDNGWDMLQVNKIAFLS